MTSQLNSLPWRPRARDQKPGPASSSSDPPPAPKRRAAAAKAPTASTASRKPVEKARAAEEPPLKKPRAVAAKAAAELIVKDEVTAKAAAKVDSEVVGGGAQSSRFRVSGFEFWNLGFAVRHPRKHLRRNVRRRQLRWKGR